MRSGIRDGGMDDGIRSDEGGKGYDPGRTACSMEEEENELGSMGRDLGKKRHRIVEEEDIGERPGRRKQKRMFETALAAGKEGYLGEGRWLVQHPRAKYGLLRGNVDRPADGVPCSIWSSRLPLWIPAAKALGMKVVNVSLGPRAMRGYGAFIARHYPDVAISAPPPSSRYNTAEAVVLCDDRRSLPPADHFFWSKVSMVVIAETGTKRPVANIVPTGWQYAYVAMDHSTAGGVTTSRGFTTVIGRNLGSLQRIPTFPPASMALILDDCIGGRVHFPVSEPATPAREPILIKKTASRRFSAFGLLPHNEVAIQVVAPSVFATPKMVVRPLSATEIAKAWDLPTTFVDGMSSAEKALFVDEAPQQVPTRLLHEALRVIWRSSAGGVGPARTLRSYSNQHPNEDQVDSRHLYDAEPFHSRSTSKRSTSKGPSDDDDREAAKRRRTSDVLHPHVETDDDGTTDLEEPVEAHVAAKNDDADVPIYIWNEACRRLWNPTWGETPSDDHLESLFAALRRGALRWWKCAIRKEFWRWHQGRSLLPRRGVEFVRWNKESGCYTWQRRGQMEYARAHTGLRQNANFRAGADCLRRAANSSWWDWDDGSRTFFWRWKGREMLMRDGQPHRLVGDLPAFRRRQTKPKNKEAVVKKISKVRKRDYIAQGETVRSLIPMFDVPKGTNDIRLVYNGTSSGLNSALYGPHFSLPTVDTTRRALVSGTHHADIDIGEMFLNFMLDPKLRPYCGVDVSEIRSDDQEFEQGRRSSWEAWCRLWMGQTDSPYLAVQCLLWGEEIILGNRRDGENPFQWSRVAMNLPGDTNYDPSKPWVAKVRRDGELASDVFLYVDDARTVGHNFEACWRATRRYASMCNWLGVQDAGRKRTMPSMTPGPWAGTVVNCAEGLEATVSQAKWTKGRSQVEEIAGMLKKNPNSLPRERLESIRGFLVYLCRTYTDFVPYLKGLHLTLDSWRAGRDYGGWKLRGRELIAAVEEGKVTMEQPENAPSFVRAVDRLVPDVEALLLLMESEVPPTRPLRSKTTIVGLIVGDASGEAKGAVLCRGSTIEYVTAEWTDVAKQQSSNWREATNLVDRIEGDCGHAEEEPKFVAPREA